MKNSIICGDCIEVMRGIQDNSVDAIVTDPPYFLMNKSGSGFMGKEWDSIDSLWKYLWLNGQFVDSVEKLLKFIKVERNLEEDVIVPENANIPEENLRKNLWLESEPELIIRTGGEKRTSNFLIWQSAYSEWIFLDKMWPEFTREDLVRCISEFKNRERRFGK